MDKHDSKKWLKLFELAPALNTALSEDLYFNGHVWFLDDVSIGDDTAAALIRDKAVWWLSKLEPIKAVSLSTSEDGHASVLCNHRELGWEEFNDEDPTEALRLACCHMLKVIP